MTVLIDGVQREIAWASSNPKCPDCGESRTRRYTRAWWGGEVAWWFCAACALGDTGTPEPNQEGP